MLKIALFTIVHLFFTKSLANGSVVGNRNNESNQWLQSFDAVTSPIKTWFTEQDDTTQTRESDSSDHNMDAEERDLFEGTESPRQFSDLLDMLRTEIDKPDDNEKKNYQKLFTNLKQLLTQKSRYAKIFFKNMWHFIDLGPYNSNQRIRNASAAGSILEHLQDLLSWIYRQAYDLFTWNLKPKKDASHENHPNTDQEHKEKHDDHTEDSSKITSHTDPDGKSVHKVVHKFDLDAFQIKLDMDITCRIFDERDGATRKDSSHSSNSTTKSKEDSKPSDTKSDDSKSIAHRSPEKDVEKMNRENNQQQGSADHTKKPDDANKSSKKDTEPDSDNFKKSDDTTKSPKNDGGEAKKTELAEEPKTRSAQRHREPGFISGMTGFLTGRKPDTSSKEKEHFS